MAIHLFIYLSIYLPIYLFICLSIYLSIYLFIHLSSETTNFEHLWGSNKLIKTVQILVVLECWKKTVFARGAFSLETFFDVFLVFFLRAHGKNTKGRARRTETFETFIFCPDYFDI
jgi:hypothetical protein